ncbi:MAG: DUF4127 family protein [Rhodanobacteraceae bacterium]|nr:DUF4127 family protein [Rhodanobacteraceae bacterium]
MFKLLCYVATLLTVLSASPLRAQTVDPIPSTCVPYADQAAGKCEAVEQDITRWLPATPISIVVDGTPLVLDPNLSPPVFIKNGRTFVELNAVFNALGLTLIWDQTLKRITATKDDLQLTMYQGYAYAYKRIRGREAPFMTLGSAPSSWTSPFIAYVPGKRWNRTVVPISFIASATGADVKWDAAAQRVTITRGRSYFFDWYKRLGQSNPSGTYVQFTDKSYRAAGASGPCAAGSSFDDEAAACAVNGQIQGPFPSRFLSRCAQLGYAFCASASWPKAEYLNVLDTADVAAGNLVDTNAALEILRANPELYGAPNEQNEIVSAGLYSRDGSGQSGFQRAEAALPPFVLSARRQTDSMVRTAYLMLPASVRRSTGFIWVDRLAQDPDSYLPYLRKKQKVVLIGTFMGPSFVKAENDAGHQSLRIRHARELFKLRSAIALVKSMNLEVADVLWATGDTHASTPELQALYDRIFGDLKIRFDRILDAANLGQLKRPIPFGGDELAVIAFARSLGVSRTVYLDLNNPDAKPRYDGGRTVRQIVDAQMAQNGLTEALSPTGADIEYYVIGRDASDFYTSTADELAKFAQIRALPVTRRQKSYISDIRFPNGSANGDSAPNSCEWLGYSGWGTGNNNVGMALAFAKLLTVNPNPLNARRMYLEAVAYDVYGNGYFDAQRGELKARIGASVYQHHPGYREDQASTVYSAFSTANSFVNEKMLAHFSGTSCLPSGSTTPFKITAQLWRHFEADVHLWPSNIAAGGWLVPGQYRVGVIPGAPANMADVLDPTLNGPSQVTKVDLAYLMSE